MRNLFAQADAIRLPLADKSVTLTIGSPPYTDARLYLEDGRDLGISRGCDEWIDWMIRVTAECLRVSTNCVIWVAAGVTRNRNYQSACEGLMDAWRRRQVPSGVWEDGIELPGEAGSMYRPVCWHRVGIPGSGGKDWFRADVEYCMCFKRPGPLPISDNTACGHAPKFGPGGEMSYRVKDGHRRNQWGKHENSKDSQRRADGTRQGPSRPSHVFGDPVYIKNIKGKGHESRDGREEQGYRPPTLANPGNILEAESHCMPDLRLMVTRLAIGEIDADTFLASMGLVDLGPGYIRTKGGHLGWEGAHDNVAPFPMEVPEFFIKSLTRPGDVVLDPFSGSGTTVNVANNLGRIGIGFDLRMSQCLLGRRRMDRPHAPKVKKVIEHIEGALFF